MSEKNIRDLIIVGGGPAGLTAGLYACRAGLSAVLIESSFTGGQIATTSLLENYPGFPQGIGGVEIGMAMTEQAQKFGLEIVYEQAVKLELSEKMKQVQTDMQGWEAPQIILAMGAEPRKLGVEREDALRGRGVSYCATCDGSFYRGGTVAVVGGGDTACEDALYLSRLAKKVFLIHRREALRATRLLQSRVMESENIEILYSTRVKRLLGQEKLTGAVLEGQHAGELALDGLFVAVGTVPRSALAAEQLELDKTGAVITDALCRTSLPGAYAVGDLRNTPLRQVITAAADGALAATLAAQEA